MEAHFYFNKHILFHCFDGKVPLAHIHSHRPVLEFLHWTTNQKILF